MRQFLVTCLQLLFLFQSLALQLSYLLLHDLALLALRVVVVLYGFAGVLHGLDVEFQLLFNANVLSDVAFKLLDELLIDAGAVSD